MEVIDTISQLKRRPRSEEALAMLRKVASLVKPIMKKEGLRVKTLCEFYPKDSRLLGLNVNHGVKVCLRLRPPGNEGTFYPMEFVLGTMLHELAHNRHGPHDRKFYEYMDSLKAQFESLMLSGYTGEGFQSEGKVLGTRPGSRPGQVPLSVARERAVKAAERRKVLYSGSGQKLGTIDGSNGSGVKAKEKKPLSVLVREAAERRQRDAKWCASGRIELDLDDSDLGVSGDQSRDHSRDQSRDQSRDRSVNRDQSTDQSRDQSRDQSDGGSESSVNGPSPITIVIDDPGPIEPSTPVAPKETLFVEID
uniref:ARAD1B07348p n=1 Tax=Blastobotrys adeninivorans TaxID=409370 RepID=A0A060TBG2_BLAAD